MELLSPAGSMASLHAALSNGADAVYFGGSLFNARLGAANFDNDSIKDAIAFCHNNNSKAYITLNTLTHDRDMHSAVSFAEYIYECGVDAVIVQDLGLVTLLRKYIPDLEIHSSTQMCISTLDGVNFCKSLGIKRAVLSRELSIKDISYIHEHSDMPLEVFVHGAMCMSFSGGCLFSSMVGSRSGNCGSCAQPCRKYAAIDHVPSDKELALSLGDLCMIEHIDKFKKAGVCSLKIEGRMKKPEYIASVTHAYRRAIDGAQKDEIAELKKEMQSVFSRGEFTTGYYFGDGGSCDRIASANPSQRTLDIIRSREPVVRKNTIDLYLTANIGKSAVLRAQSCGKTVFVEGAIVESPKKPITAQSIERYKAQLEKLGESAFCAGKIEVEADGFISIGEINFLRRSVCDKLSDCSKKETADIPQAISLKEQCQSSGENKICARAMNFNQAEAAFNSGADEVYIEYGLFTHKEIDNLQKYRKSKRLGIALPISLISQSAQNRLIDSINPYDFDSIEINNVGQIEYAKQFKHIVGGMHLNVFNAFTADFLLSKGIERLTVSPELTAPQLSEFMKYVKREQLCLHTYGRVVLMNLFHCPIKEHIGCAACGKKIHILLDSEKREFPLIGMKDSTPCEMVRLYNCFAHDISGLLKKQKNIPEYLVLSFTDENESVVSERIKSVLSENPLPLPNTTRGYMNR